MLKNSVPNKILKSVISILMVLLMLCSCCTFVFAETISAGGEVEQTQDEIDADEAATQASEDSSYIAGFTRENQYSDYYEAHKEYDIKRSPISIDPNAVVSNTATIATNQSFEGKDNVLVLSGNGNLVYSFNVPETGMYALEMEYFAQSDKVTRDLEFEILIDGKLPYEEASSFSMKRNWTDEEDEPIYDSVDNQLLPTQVLSLKWLTKSFQDPNGNYMEPIKFYLEAGTHTITLNSISGTFALASLKFYNDGAQITYDEYKAQHDSQGAVDSTQYLVLEAEDYEDKTDSIIQAAYDRSDPKVTPYNVSRTRLNTIGGENWNSSQQMVNWTIDVPESGYYTLSFKFRQSFVRGATVYRRIYIDGVVPFEEANTIGFSYGIGYRNVTAGRTVDDVFEPYKIYLEKGTHTFSMEAVVGDMAESSREIEDVVYQLNYIYRKIIMVTGTSPDNFRDYKLDTSVVGLTDMFESVSATLKEIKQTVDNISTGTGGSSEILTTLAVQIDSFLEKPYTIPSRLSTFKDNISTLGAWMLEIRDQPLQIDKITFAGENVSYPRQNANVFEKIVHEVSAFMSSFIDDYTTIGSQTEGGRSITVWVGTGRDQAMVLKTLADNYFTPETDIGVNISLVPLAVLSKAIISGRGPDVALSVSRTEPMNLGIRNAVVDLNEFEDIDEVLDRFTDYAARPYTLDTTSDTGEKIYKIFALPETQNFHMMFYRTDVFEELNIEVPQTWDEFDQILPYIQQNNMTVGIDSHLSESNPTPGGLFYTLIQQQGQDVYNANGETTNFTEQYAVDAFETWTRYYTMYDFPLQYDAYTRFRNGEMPLVIQSYSQITYIAQSAPELRGLWGVAPIPGTLDEETGEINRSEESRAVTGCMIVKNGSNDPEVVEQKKNDSWEFLKWWTSAETSAEYGNRIEMAIGPVARYTTANLEAFELLNWTAEEATAIKEQRSWVKELPELVGGYYVGRTIINAFRNVTNNNTNPREMLFYYNDQINAEIWRKRMEYNLSVPEEAYK